MHPIILFDGNYTEKDLQNFRKKHKIWKEIDVYEDQLRELFEIQQPYKLTSATFKKELAEYLSKQLDKNSKIKGNWIYFPWNGHFVHTVAEEDYYDLRTNRNRHIITDKEQKILYDSCVGFLGLSIGQHMALGLAYNGIAKHMKLAEFDTLSTSNLNRVHAGIKDIGKAKNELASELLYEINPYQEITNYTEGLTGKTLHDFFDNRSKLNIVFEACDDFKLKIKVRIEARKRRIPVIMLTNLADSILIDIERYDLDPKLPLFHGLLGDLPQEIIANEISEKDKVRYAKDLVGVEFIPTRVLQTLYDINKKVVGRPQLNSTVTVAGGLAAYLARRILLKKHVWSGRKHISFNTLLKFDEDDDHDVRKDIIEKLSTATK
jgi:tRNA threonylcarbamoyladenosine dehydratase